MSNTIEYNGYIGTIKYSQEDKCFFGKLVLTALILFLYKLLHQYFDFLKIELI